MIGDHHTCKYSLHSLHRFILLEQCFCQMTLPLLNKHFIRTEQQSGNAAFDFFSVTIFYMFSHLKKSMNDSTFIGTSAVLIYTFCAFYKKMQTDGTLERVQDT